MASGSIARAALAEKAGAILDRLCRVIPNRQTGSAGNRQATAFFAAEIAATGFQVECPEFACMDWTHGEAELIVAGESFAALVSPYSLGCAAHAELCAASTEEELAAADAEGKILLLRGELTAEQLMPKNFVFYNPDHHQRIIRTLEAKRPAAIVAATGRDPEMAGAAYPFPLIEDGDFDIPSVYMTDVEGERLAVHAGEAVRLRFAATRIPATGCNVIARKGLAGATGKIVMWAHIDAKAGTPGALDNGTGVATLLLLADLLRDYEGRLDLEIVALNGEDYYAASGEMQYLALFGAEMDRIVLGVNIDGAGYREGGIAYSLYGCPEEMAAAIRRVFATYPDMAEGEQWYQSDHTIFVQHGRPALAITSERVMELVASITHTAQDTPELVDTNQVADIALALRDLCLHLGDTAG